MTEVDQLIGWLRAFAARMRREYLVSTELAAPLDQAADALAKLQAALRQIIEQEDYINLDPQPEAWAMADIARTALGDT